MVMRKLGLFVALLSGAASAAVPFKNGTEVHRGFMSPHRIHVFRISEAGRKFALEKGLAYLRNGKH